MLEKADILHVNNVFGEGTSPRLRMLRDGLSALGFTPDLLLSHGQPRVVYGISLIRNLRDFLLGFDAEPDYLLPLEETELRTQEIGAWWRERWLSRRIDRPEVLEAVSSHALSHPICHGARVVLPQEESEEGQLELYGV
jgi:hypothetical protein